MATSADVKKRAKELAGKKNTNSVSPAEVGNLIYDNANYIEDVERNGGTLGIRKVYASIAALEADSAAPVDFWGNRMKKGNLVAIYDGTAGGVDNNKVFAFQKPGWKIVTELDAGYAVRGELTEVAERTTGNYFSISGRIAIDGTVAASAGLYRTDYIPIKNVRSVMVCGTSSNITAVIAFYDQNYAFISSVYGTENSNKPIAVDVPEGAVLCRCSGYPGKSFVITEGATSLLKSMLNAPYTNVTIEYPPAEAYHTLQTAREAIPVEFRRRGHLISFSDSHQHWSWYFYRGIQSRNDNPTGWNSDDFWVKIPTGQEVEPLQLDIEMLKKIVTNKVVDFSNYPMTEPMIIRSDNGAAYSENIALFGATLDYIPCKGATRIEVTLPQNAAASTVAGYAFYDENKAFVSGQSRPTGNPATVVIKITVPSNGAYFRTSYWNAANRGIHGEFSCMVYYDAVREYDEVTLDEREIIDGNSINYTTGEIQAAQTLGCTSYMDCAGVSNIELTVQVNTTNVSEAGLAFYDKDKVYLSGVPRITSTYAGTMMQNIAVPENAAYFRTGFWDFERRNGVLQRGRFSCKLKYPKGFLGYGKYRPHQDGQIHFCVKVNQAVSNYWDTAKDVQDNENHKGSTGVLILPDSYTSTGKPTPIIMYCHGMSHPVTYTQWGTLTSATVANEVFLAQKERWRQKGFAVFDCNGPKDDGGRAVHANGCPQAVSAYRQSFEYIREYYNVEGDVCVVGGSMGGAVALNYYFTYNNVKALALLSAWTNLFTCAWGQGVKAPFVEFFGFTGTATYEEDKVLGYDPSSRIMELGGKDVLLSVNKAPIKYWLGADEVTSALGKAGIRFVEALRNGFNMAFFRKVADTGHELTSGGSVVVDEEVGIWFKRMV